MKLGDDTIVLVTRVPTGQRDRYGNEILTDAFTEVRWCLVTPTASVEPDARVAPRITGLQVLAPPRTALAAAAAVIYPPEATGDPDVPWSGPRYEVDGDAGDWGDFVQAQLGKAV